MILDCMSCNRPYDQKDLYEGECIRCFRTAVGACEHCGSRNCPYLSGADCEELLRGQEESPPPPPEETPRPPSIELSLELATSMMEDASILIRSLRSEIKFYEGEVKRLQEEIDSLKKKEIHSPKKRRVIEEIPF